MRIQPSCVSTQWSSKKRTFDFGKRIGNVKKYTFFTTNLTAAPYSGASAAG